MTSVIITFIAGIVVGFFGSILLDKGHKSKEDMSVWSDALQHNIDELHKLGSELRLKKTAEEQDNDQE